MSERCKSYVGITCVDGTCPNALAEEYSEYGYEKVSCIECGFNKGCEDCGLPCCGLCDRPLNDKMEGEKK